MLDPFATPQDMTEKVRSEITSAIDSNKRELEIGGNTLSI